jgi:hypothetical protein
MVTGFYPVMAVKMTKFFLLLNFSGANGFFLIFEQPEV